MVKLSGLALYNIFPAKMDTNNTTVVQVHRSAVSDEYEDDDDSRSIASVDPLVQNKQPVDSQLYTVLDSLNNGMNNNNALLEKLISALKPNMPSGNSESSTNSRKRENNAELSSDTPAPKRAKPAPKTGQNVHGNAYLPTLKKFFAGDSCSIETESYTPPPP